MILQMCAWTGMVARFAQEGPVTEAISKTLDGKHPCRLCHAVRDGRAEERKAGKAAMVAPVKWDLLMANLRPTTLGPVESDGRLMTFGFLARPSKDRSSPPVPPPRAA